MTDYGAEAWGVAGLLVALDWLFDVHEARRHDRWIWAVFGTEGLCVFAILWPTWDMFLQNDAEWADSDTRAGPVAVLAVASVLAILLPLAKWIDGHEVTDRNAPNNAWIALLFPALIYNLLGTWQYEWLGAARAVIYNVATLMGAALATHKADWKGLTSPHWPPWHTMLFTACQSVHVAEWAQLLCRRWAFGESMSRWNDWSPWGLALAGVLFAVRTGLELKSQRDDANAWKGIGTWCGKGCSGIGTQCGQCCTGTRDGFEKVQVP